MRSVDEAVPDLLLEAGSREIQPRTDVPSDSIGTAEYRARLHREGLARRTLREKLADGVRRAWYGPAPAPLTDEEMRMIMRPGAEDDDLPERVPPDDPVRLAFEADLRAMGVSPAKKWNFPERAPIRRPGLWKRIRYRIRLGW
jgi:hypothetical protein